MVSPINPINPINPVNTPVSSGSGAGGGSGIDFKKILSNALDSVNSSVQNAETLSNDFAAGKTSDIHSVVIAAEKADITLQLTNDVKNKIVTAYQDIMRMQI